MTRYPGEDEDKRLHRRLPAIVWLVDALPNGHSKTALLPAIDNARDVLRSPADKLLHARVTDALDNLWPQLVHGDHEALPLFASVIAGLEGRNAQKAPQRDWQSRGGVTAGGTKKSQASKRREYCRLLFVKARGPTPQKVKRGEHSQLADHLRRQWTDDPVKAGHRPSVKAIIGYLDSSGFLER